MNPDVDRGDGQKRIKASGDTLPPDHQATIFLLKPGKCPLRLEPWDDFFDRSATVFLALPHTLWQLCSDPTLAQGLAQSFRIIPLIRRDDFQAFARASPLARVDLDRIEQRHHLGTLIPVGGRSAVRQWHAVPLGEAVDQDPLALPPAGDALAATLARGKKRRQWRHTPTESSLVPQPRPESALAWRPTSHPPASAATTGASHSSMPTAAPGGRHTTGPR